MDVNRERERVLATEREIEQCEAHIERLCKSMVCACRTGRPHTEIMLAFELLEKLEENLLLAQRHKDHLERRLALLSHCA